MQRTEKITRRGYVAADKKEFGPAALPTLKAAQKELYWLINRGYPIKSASTFVGNHHLLSERQRLALVRATSTELALAGRARKKLGDISPGSTVYIDGLNLIITLEVALSGSTIIRCMDQTVRDLAGLRGTYRIIDKTEIALDLIGQALKRLAIGEAVFYLDAPVSNTGRLKTALFEKLGGGPFSRQVELVPNADAKLWDQERVISGDAIVLDRCRSWLNMAYLIIESEIGNCFAVDLSGNI